MSIRHTVEKNKRSSSGSELRLIDQPEKQPTPPSSGLRLIFKPEVIDRTGLSYQTLWSKMREGTFPRSLDLNGRVAWYQHEIDQWLRALPRRRLKGDA